ncbi:MAG: hypothetical protein E6J31_04455 [Chloroflexi bacterium]|nr:MAG: hypothetical protein E6J31_04455 [Chloroflexota bacterium]
MFFCSLPYLTDSSLFLRLCLEENHRTFFLPPSSIKVCPICLGEYHAYDRLYWRTRFLVTCPQHVVILRESCPTCHAAIPSLRPSPILCSACGKGNYRASPCSLEPYLQEALLLLASDLLTLKALGIEDTTIDNSLPSSQLEELGSLAPRNYFSLLRSICKVVRVFSADYLLAFLTPEFHTLLAQLQGLLATFHKILLKCSSDSMCLSN